MRLEEQWAKVVVAWHLVNISRWKPKFGAHMDVVQHTKTSTPDSRVIYLGSQVHSIVCLTIIIQICSFLVSCKCKQSMLLYSFNDKMLNKVEGHTNCDVVNLDKVTIVQLLWGVGPFLTCGIGIYAFKEILYKTGEQKAWCDFYCTEGLVSPSGIPPLTLAKDVFCSHLFISDIHSGTIDVRILLHQTYDSHK